MRWGVVGREGEVKSDIPYRERNLSWEVTQTKDSDGTGDPLSHDQLPPKESWESYCVNSAAGKKNKKNPANWPEPKNFNESQMWAEATSWTGPPEQSRNDWYFFSNTDQMGPVLFSRKTCLMSRSCSMALHSWLNTFTPKHPLTAQSSWWINKKNKFRQTCWDEIYVVFALHSHDNLVVARGRKLSGPKQKRPQAEKMIFCVCTYFRSPHSATFSTYCDDTKKNRKDPTAQ